MAKKWVVEYWDGDKWCIEAEFDNKADCASYYVNIRFDYQDVLFRVREE